MAGENTDLLIFCFALTIVVCGLSRVVGAILISIFVLIIAFWDQIKAVLLLAAIN